MADNWVVAPILPSISKEMGINVASASLIISAYMIPFGLFQLVFGYLADKFGKRQVISFAMVFFTIATGLCSIAVGLTDLAIYRTLTGVFAASVMPISLALIGDIFPLNERQAAIGTFLGISFLGQGLSMAIGGSIAFFFNWRGVFFIYAILSIVITGLLLTVGRSIPSTKNENNGVFAPYANLLKNTKSLKIYGLVLFEGFFLLGSFSFLSGFIQTTYNFNNFWIGLIMSTFGVMSIIGGRISGKVSAKHGRKRTILLGLTCALLAMIIIISLGNVLGTLIIGIGLLGLGLMLAHSTFLTIATEFAARTRGAAMSLVAFCFMGGGGLGTALGSRIVENSGFLSLFMIYGMGLLLLILAVTMINKSFNITSLSDSKAV
jgi:predicted MFS family arabinose efflux permease